MPVLSIPENLVFGLDIGTRSVVGTVGFVEGEIFHAVAQYVKHHETRAMVDGQIHDIIKVGETIKEVKKELEQMIGRELTEVCIAAAGRVLRTVTTNVEMELEEESVVTQENIYSLDLLGVEKAQEELNKNNDTDEHFYCVGYSVIRYYLNDYVISNLEGHKAKKIAEDVIATFLPDEVVDSLYTAVQAAGLEVANLTLEPIAAINVAIPEKFRMLNIGLIDVGAGTSDICITKDGSIVAYGMIPMAGDELTEVIAKQYLVEFDVAEHIKTSVRDCYEALKAHPNEEMPKIQYEDILGLPHEIDAEEIVQLVDPIIEEIATQVASKMKELNGEKSVSAVFVVGGGGKIPGFTEKIAEKLDLIPERVALRGEEVLRNVEFYQQDVKKDSLLVTPIGICLNYYDRKNNFIFVQFNGERMKLYNNTHLTVVEAAMQAGFPNDQLFPKRGKELNYSVNGKARMIRGQIGEAAVISVNGIKVDLNTPIESNDKIKIKPSTAGAAATLSIEDLPEFHHQLNVKVNGNIVTCPVFVQANKELVSGFYEIKENDEITVLNYYTLRQILEYMDVILPNGTVVYVNNKVADFDEKVYDNFTVDWEIEAKDSFDEPEVTENDYMSFDELEEHVEYENLTGTQETILPMASTVTHEAKKPVQTSIETQEAPEVVQPFSSMVPVMINGKPVVLKGKSSYVFVDVFDFIEFDLSKMRGSGIVTKVNGVPANYMQNINAHDNIEIYWEE